MHAIVPLPLRIVFWTIFINHIQICGTILPWHFIWMQLLQYYHGFHQPARGCHLIAESRPQCPSIICSIDLALTFLLCPNDTNNFIVTFIISMGIEVTKTCSFHQFFSKIRIYSVHCLVDFSVCVVQSK